MRWWLGLFFLMGSGLPLTAAPHVVGYERFCADAVSVRGGAILYSELGCANCHGESPVMIARSGPNLMDLSQRVERDWVDAFLKDPASGREGSAMPSMAHALSDEDREKLLAYLSSLDTNPKYPTARHANAEGGSALFHEKGCVACHAPTADFKAPHEAQDSDFPLAVSLPDLAAKTHFKALAAFLTSPSDFRSDGRMPHLPLESQEAVDLAAHLLDFQSSNPRDDAKPLAKWPKVATGQIEAGRAIAKNLNCAACHVLPDLESKAVIEIKNTKGGCLSGDLSISRPSYQLREDQLKSLRVFLGADSKVLNEDPHLTLAAMNCYACHERDGVGGPMVETNPFFVGDESLGDSGRLPPPLTGIGRKLKSEWMKGVLSGDTGKHVRPYLKTMMPGYPGHAEVLTTWLVKLDKEDGLDDWPAEVGDLEAGRKLLGTHGGVNCITCHNWGEKESLGISALDISSLNERLHPEWFRQYMLNPASYRPGTLMPALWPGGRSTIPDVLDGDAEKQMAAIWQFIADGEGVPDGFPDFRPGQFELIPDKRPMIQRTFLEGSGTKSILVGFPGGINLAFDGLSGQPALVWLGRFFDAYDTWFVRKIEFQKPAGEEAFAFGKIETDIRFRGYRVDEGGNPVFLLEHGGKNYEECYTVVGGMLHRKVTWESGDEPPSAHPENVSTERVSANNAVKFLYSWK